MEVISIEETTMRYLNQLSEKEIALTYKGLNFFILAVDSCQTTSFLTSDEITEMSKLFREAKIWFVKLVNRLNKLDYILQCYDN